jgi:hypothetical protein
MKICIFFIYLSGFLLVGCGIVSGDDYLIESRKVIDKARLLSGALRAGDHIRREEIVRSLGIRDKSDQIRIGEPYRGVVGVSEIWLLKGGFSVKVLGRKSVAGKSDDVSRAMLNQVISGKIADNMEVYEIGIFNKSGRCVL